MHRLSDQRPFKKALLLICEGTITEPYFFGSFRDDKDRCKIEEGIEILPKPLLTKEDVSLQINRGNNVRQKRQLKDLHIKKSIFIGPPPLNWVQAGIQKLDTYEEVWCVFDKDDHPKRAEAFKLVDECRKKGKNINIAFSSRCIEYYFLLHFEYIYKAFEKSECNEKVNDKSRVFHCGLPDADVEKACNGERCVNGYARIKKYWIESKKDNSLYPILKNRLLFAVKNAEMVRRESWKMDEETPIYDRNPYVTTDYLVARFLGYTIITTGNSLLIKEEGTDLNIDLNEHELVIKNEGKVSYILKEDFVSEKALLEGDSDNPCCKKTILAPGNFYSLELNSNCATLYCINCTSHAYLFLSK